MLTQSDLLAGASFEEPRHFEIVRIPLHEEPAALLGVLRNYAENGLRLHLRHGFALRLRLPRPMLALAHPRHVCRVLKTHVQNYPKSSDYDFLHPLLGNGVFVSDGDFWARQRRLMSTEFRPSAVGRFLPVLVEAVE